jgi:large subunit ribosomal protein L22
VVRYARVSASKARPLLDEIRGQSVGGAAEFLAFSERAVARVIGRCLDSAVANAVNNVAVPADELYVSACFADQGPTLQRWRPRARGRATRIRKRTCHITVIVSRYEEDELTAIRARKAGRARPVGSPEEPTGDRRRGLRTRARDKKEANPEGQALSEEVTVVDEALSEEVTVVDETLSEEDAVENEAGEEKAERAVD